MDSALDFANLFVTNEAGELLYFLAAVGLSLAALLIAVDQRTRSKNEVIAGRYMIALMGVAAAWGLLTAGNLLVLLAPDVNDRQILPPLERAAITLVLVMLGWAFLMAENPQRDKTTRPILAVIGVLVGAAYVFTLILWDAKSDFNQHHLGLAWTLIPLVFAVIGLGLMLMPRFHYAADIPLKMLFFLLVIAGHVYTLYQMLTDNLQGDAAGAVRLSMLAALVIVPVLLYRMVIDRFREAVGEISDMVMTVSQPMPPVAPPPVYLPAPYSTAQREAVSLLKILGIMLEKPQLEMVPAQITVAVANTFKSDIVALVLANNPNWVEIMAVYDYIREQHVAGLTINLENQPTLASAIERGLPTSLAPGRNDAEITDLLYRLDSQQQAQPSGPAYFQPLMRDRKVMGMLILALPYTTRSFTPEERQLLEALSPIAARLLILSEEGIRDKLQASSNAILRMRQGIPPSLPEMDTGRTIRAEMQEQLELAQKQIEELGVQVRDLEQRLNHEREKLNVLVQEGTSDMSLTQKIQAISEERQQLAQQREQLVSALQHANAMLAGATADNEEVVYRQLILSLRDERNTLAQEKERLEQELRLLQATAGDSGALSKLLQKLRTERDRLVSERGKLHDQIKDAQGQLAQLGLEGGAVGVGQMLAHLTEERNRYQQESQQLLAERDLLLRERQGLAPTQLQQREQQIEALSTELSHIAHDREAILRQRDALKAERDSLNQQREEWLTWRIQMSERYEELRQKFHKANLALADSFQKRVALEDELKDKVSGNAEKRLHEIEEDRSNLEFELIRAREEMEVLQRELMRYQKLVTAPTPNEQEQDMAQTIVGQAQELRTPLTSMMGYVDLLLSESSGILGATQQQFLLRVKVNVERLQQMLEDLLRVMAIDLGTLALAPQNVDMVDLVDDAITASSAQYREKGLTLHLDLAEDMPAIVADKDAMQQVLNHLLTNAYLATPPDSIVRVTARHEPQFKANNITNPQNVIFFAITDQGGGIPPEEQPRVFTRKYRPENPLIQGLGDKGVGMSVVHALITAHGGKIWFETQPGFSTTFKFIIPVDHAFGERDLMRGSVNKLIGALEDEA